MLTGAETQLGASVGDVVSDGQGRLRNIGVFANAYYDFPVDWRLQPYLGVGVGYIDVSARYTPSAVGIIDGSDAKLAYQAKAGATYRLANRFEVYSEFAYRATGDVQLENDLFPGTLDIENRQSLVSFGACFAY